MSVLAQRIYEACPCAIKVEKLQGEAKVVPLWQEVKKKQCGTAEFSCCRVVGQLFHQGRCAVIFSSC